MELQKYFKDLFVKMLLQRYSKYIVFYFLVKEKTRKLIKKFDWPEWLILKRYTIAGGKKQKLRTVFVLRYLSFVFSISVR